jgi:hypothetical protein
MTDIKQKSWYARIFGRSFISILFGNFFEKKNNSAGIIAITLVGTLCFVVIHNLLKGSDIAKEMETIANIVFVVIGYYFGTKQGKTSDEGDE